jgi:hypothetical protein
MAVIDYVTLKINRTSYPHGHTCSIDYSYLISIDQGEYDDEITYSVSCMLCGHDFMHNKKLGEPPYDVHTISSREKMPVVRGFLVPCSLLDEAWGKDEIFIKLFVQSSDGVTLTAKSEPVKDWF